MANKDNITFVIFGNKESCFKIGEPKLIIIIIPHLLRSYHVGGHVLTFNINL